MIVSPPANAADDSITPRKTITASKDNILFVLLLSLLKYLLLPVIYIFLQILSVIHRSINLQYGILSQSGGIDHIVPRTIILINKLSLVHDQQGSLVIIVLQSRRRLAGCLFFCLLQIEKNCAGLNQILGKLSL